MASAVAWRCLWTFFQVAAWALTWSASPVSCSSQVLKGWTWSRTQPRPMAMRVPMGSDAAAAASKAPPTRARPPATQSLSLMAWTRASPSSRRKVPARGVVVSLRSATRGFVSGMLDYPPIRAARCAL